MSENEAGEIVIGDPKNLWEKGFRRIGERVVKPAANYLTENRLDTFNLEVKNEENLDLLKEQAHILVSNHQIPEDLRALVVGIGPDSFIIAKAVKDRTGKDIHFLGQYGQGVSPFIKFFPPFLKQKWKEMHRGLMSGTQTLSFDSSPLQSSNVQNIDESNSNRRLRPTVQLFKDAQTVINAGDSILIYPYGFKWHTDGQLAERVQRGPAFLARKLDVPILPIYIDGAKSWKKGEQATVVVGNSFTTEGVTDEQVGKMVQEGILGLRAEIT